jgi:hypothetical protein
MHTKMNTLKNIGTKLAAAVVATGLIAGTAFGAGSVVTVNLPEAVNVGNTILASGQYTITEFSLSSGRSIFVFRSDKGETASVVGSRTADAPEAQKTVVVLSHEGGALHVDKLFIEGDQTGIQFADSK